MRTANDYLNKKQHDELVKDLKEAASIAREAIGSANAQMRVAAFDHAFRHIRGERRISGDSDFNV